MMVPAGTIRASCRELTVSCGQVVPLEPPRRFLDTVDLVNLEVQLDVLAQLLQVQAVPLQVRDRLAARAGDQVGERTSDRLGRPRTRSSIAACSPWEYRF